MEQKIFFKKGKLVVITDNGLIEDGKTTTSIDGNFVIKAEDVKELLSRVSGMNFYTSEYRFYSADFCSDRTRNYTVSQTTAEIVDLIKKEYEAKRDELQETHAKDRLEWGASRDSLEFGIKNLSDEIKKLKSEKASLQERIDNHNSKLFTFKKI